MFIYLSKKIAIPNCSNVHSVAWNNEQGYVAVGGDDALLKVLKLETSNNPDNKGSQLSMNQTLEGHSGIIQLSTWNKQHQKLTTSDSNGLIIVWVLYKGMWYEEMVNNRNKGVVTGMKWDRTGQRICIVYEDGAVILGSVDGNRIWGKEVKNTCLAHVQWSPDGNFLLFATTQGQLQLFDGQGTFVAKLNDFWHMSEQKIASMDWYNGASGYLFPDVPCLAVCYEDGKVQILRDQKDFRPIKFETTMKFNKLLWNRDGSLLAIAGQQFVKESGGIDEKESCVVQFWTPFGEFLRSIKIPGKQITSISWENDGLRLALAVDQFIYFANIRPDYRWSFFANDVLVYSFVKPETIEANLIFWNTKSNERYKRSVHNLVSLSCAGDYCLAITKASDGSKDTLLTVYDAIGVAIETKTVEFEVKYSSVSKSHVLVANDNIIYHWQFKPLVNVKLTALDVFRKKQERDRCFHIDDMETIGMCEVSTTLADAIAKTETGNPIISIASSEVALFVARQNGDIYQYLLPSLELDNKYSVSIQPTEMALNCNSTRLSLLDKNGILKLFELEKQFSSTKTTSPYSPRNSTIVNGSLIDFERKDVWNIKWASDNPEMFAIMEKTKMYIFNGLQAEDPLPTSGCKFEVELDLCEFRDLQIKTAQLDDILKEPETPKQSCIVTLEVKDLRDFKSLLQVNMKVAIEQAEEKKIPKLWSVLAFYTLDLQQYEIAETAFVRSQNYHGIQFIKKIKKFEDPKKKLAEVAAFCNEYEKAEKLYLEIDRKDLAIELRSRIGDWFRVVQLLKTGGGGNDQDLENAWNNIGDYYHDRQRWPQAITYYSQGRNIDRLIELYCLQEDYENLERLANGLSDNNIQLRTIAEKFVAVGLWQPAYNAYMKLGDVSSAINACVYLNQWSMAIELAESHKFKEIEQLLTKYATYILSQGKKKEAIELFRKANYCLKSAKLLFELGQDSVKAGHSPTNIKRFFVLGALEVERHLSIQRSNKLNAIDALSGLLLDDTDDARVLQNPWRYAEAYHYYILSQRQFFNGQMDSAVLTALHLRDYEDIIDPEIIYSLLALVSLHAGYFETCSKSFIRLESLESIGAEKEEYYSTLAVSIFTKNKPKDPESDFLVCSSCVSPVKETESSCSTCQMQFPTCIASGRPILDSVHFMCHVCKHRALESEISNYNNCPLCHTIL